MSGSLPKDYNKASRLLEGFSSFFEKLAYFSQDSDKNLEKLANFKRTICLNMHSRSKIQHLLATSLKDNYSLSTSSDTKASEDMPSLITTLKKAKSQGPQIVPNEDRRDSLQIPAIALYKDKPAVLTQVTSSNRGLQELNSSMNSAWAQLQTTDDFLGQIRASMHMDSDEILTFIPSFSLVRSFNQPPEAAFYALCFAFFERYVKKKFDEPRISLLQEVRTYLENLDNDSETLAKYLDKQFLSLIRNFSKRSENEDDIVNKFYEEVSTNSSFYSSCLLLFKKILLKILEKKNLESVARKSSFRWMNEISTADQGFYEGIAALFETNLRFFVLTASKLAEKAFSPAAGQQYNTSLAPKLAKQDLSILLDRSSGYAYILYQPKGVLNNGNMFTASPSKKNKQRSYSPNLRKDPHLKEIPTTLPNILKEDKRSFAIVEDDTREETRIQKAPDSQRSKKGAHVPGPSLVPIANKLYSKTPDSSPLEKPERRVETNPDEKEDWSNTRTNLLGLYNPSKSDTSTTGYNIKNKENNNTILAPKDRESAPMRHGGSGDYMNFKDTSSLVNKIMDEINQKVKVGKADTIGPQFGQERRSGTKARDNQASPEREPYFMAKPTNKGRSEMEETRKEKNKSFDINLTRDKEFKIIEVSKAKQLTLPNHFKSRLNGLNKDIIQHNQEFDQILMRYALDEGGSDVKTIKPQTASLIAIYTPIMEKGEKRDGIQPTIGTTLQMDSNCLEYNLLNR